MAPGTTLEDPVSKEQCPDLDASYHEISEYLNSHGAYDLFDYMLRELLTKQPEDPLQHMIDCLQTRFVCGPLKVIMSSAPGVGRGNVAKRLADCFGLTLISAGEILRESGVEVDQLGYADEAQAAELVLDHIAQATANLEGWVLDGFPRTRLQASYLREAAVVPTHVLVLRAPVEAILERNRLIAEGAMEGEAVDMKVLERKLALHTCHGPSALEPYAGQMKPIDALAGEDAVWSQMVKTVRTLPRSLGPRRPPRVLVLGPRGIGLREHTSRLAAQLSAVFVDGGVLKDSVDERGAKMPSREGKKSECAEARLNLDSRVKDDLLGRVGVRLRQSDCENQGWVMCGFPGDEANAKILDEDAQLSPLHVVILDATVQTCMQRLRVRHTDVITGKVWTTRPKSERIRRRLQRSPNDQPPAVTAEYAEYSRRLSEVLAVLQGDGADSRRVARIVADGNPEAVFAEAVEFVERPLPLPPPEEDAAGKRA